MGGSRREARILALQFLYELDCSKHKKGNLLKHLPSASTISPEIMNFCHKLVYGVLQHEHKIDTLINQFAPLFPIEQLAIIDRNILRLAIFELLFNNDTPVKVVINEAVEMAKKFGGASSPRFVKGVMGSIATEYDLG